MEDNKQAAKAKTTKKAPAKKAAPKKERNFEVELMEEKIKSLESKLEKPKTSEEEFEERKAKYAAKKAYREDLQKQIDKRRRELQEQIPKAKFEEIKILEAWERRAKKLEKRDPHAAQKFEFEFKNRVNQINKDPLR